MGAGKVGDHSYLDPVGIDIVESHRVETDRETVPPPLDLLGQTSFRSSSAMKSPDLDGAVEVIWGVIPPGGGTTHPSSHPGEEIIVALAGHVAVVVDDQEFVLAVGDTIRFDRSRPHRLFNPRATAAEFVLVVTPPSR